MTNEIFPSERQADRDEYACSAPLGRRSRAQMNRRRARARWFRRGALWGRPPGLLGDAVDEGDDVFIFMPSRLSDTSAQYNMQEVIQPIIALIAHTRTWATPGTMLTDKFTLTVQEEIPNATEAEIDADDRVRRLSEEQGLPEQIVKSIAQSVLTQDIGNMSDDMMVDLVMDEALAETADDPFWNTLQDEHMRRISRIIETVAGWRDNPQVLPGGCGERGQRAPSSAL